MESLVVGDIKGLATDNARLSLFTNEQGGIKVPLPIIRSTPTLLRSDHARLSHKNVLRFSFSHTGKKSFLNLF